LSPTIPFTGLLTVIAENAGLILTVVGSASLLYILSDPKNKQDVDRSLALVSAALGQVRRQVDSINISAAIEAQRQLGYAREQLNSFREKLELIQVVPIARQYLNKVNQLIQKLDQVNGNLSNRIQTNPLNVSQPEPFTYTPRHTPDFPAVPAPDRIPDFVKDVLQPLSPVYWPKPIPIPSNLPTAPPPAREQPLPPEQLYLPFPPEPQPPFPIEAKPFPDGIDWGSADKLPLNEPAPQPDGIRQLPNDTPFGFPPISQAVPRERARPRDITNLPGCKDPDSWGEKFKQFLEYAIDELGQELIQTIADRAGEVFEKAFAARDEAVRNNPDFDKGKPDLKKTLEDSIGKEYDKLSPKTKADLNAYYNVKPQPDGRDVASRKFGRGNDPTLPPIQIKNGIVIPELLTNDNRLSSGVDLGKEFAKGHGFNPTKSGVLKTAANGQSISQMVGVKELVGPVQIHHKVPDALWQSHPLTQAMQKLIDGGNKNVLGLNDSSNLIAVYKSPEAKEKYQKMLTEVGKTNPQLKYSIEINLQKLESQKVMLSDLYHNGSHDGWNKRVEVALDLQVEKLRGKFKTKDLSKIPEKYLKVAYLEVTAELGNELNKANEKLQQNQPLSENEKNWAKDYCNPKDKQKKKPHTRISANPTEDPDRDKLIAATDRLNAFNQSRKSHQLAPLSSRISQPVNADRDAPDNLALDPAWAKTMELANELKAKREARVVSQLSSAPLSSQSFQPTNVGRDEQDNLVLDPAWAKTMELANKLKAKNEARAAQREEQQLASQQQENTKQKKRGFEYGA
jgi:hypothetical protein